MVNSDDAIERLEVLRAGASELRAQVDLLASEPGLAEDAQSTDPADPKDLQK